MKELNKYKRLKPKIIGFALQNKHKEGLEFLLKNFKPPFPDEVKLDIAFFYYHLEYFQKAIKLYKEVIKNNQNCVTAIQFLGRVYSLTGKKEGIDLAKTAYILQPDFMMTNNLANVYKFLNQNKLAEIWYKKTLKLCRGWESRLVIKNNMALFYKKTNRKKLANKYASEVLKSRLINQNKYRTLINSLKKDFPELKEKKGAR